MYNNKNTTSMKRQVIFLIFVIFLFQFVDATEMDTIQPSHSDIEYTGRIDFTDVNAPKFSYSGVSIRASFSGTRIGVIMNDDMGQNYYQVLIDGQPFDTIHIIKGKKLYIISENLSDTIHEIEIVKRTEQQFGKTQFYGFVINKGDSIVQISNKRTKLFEFIGNSITCGYGNEGKNGEIFGPTTENHYMTYAAITSRNFNARHLAVCKSGIGVYRNYDGPKTGNIDCMTNYYTRIFLYDENPKYSFSEKPDLIFINLGTNDFSTSGGDSALFVSNYFRLLDTITTKYSNPEIILLAGPMMSGDVLTKVKRYLQFISDSVNKKGVAKVWFFEMSAQTGDLGIGIDYHPTVEQHMRNASELSNFIHSLKGWKVIPNVLMAKIVSTNHIIVEFNTNMIDTSKTIQGFHISENNQEFTIDSIFFDSSNKKLLHIYLKDKLSLTSDVKLSFKAGVVSSTDSVLLKSFSEFPVKNLLTQTSINKGSVSTDGLKISIIFNKYLSDTSKISGLEIKLGENILAIDSFSIKNNVLTLYFTNTPIKKGEAVMLNYTGNSIVGNDGVPLDEISNYTITNNSKYTFVQNKLTDNTLQLFPNPNSNQHINYKLETIHSVGTFKLEIYNMKGELIFSQKTADKVGQINIAKSLTAGYYIVKAKSSKFIISSSLVIN